MLLVGRGTSGYGPTPDARSAPPPRKPRPVRVAERVDVFSTSWPEADDSALAVCRHWQPDLLHLHVFWLWPIAQQLREQLVLRLVHTVHSLYGAEHQLGNGPGECTRVLFVGRFVDRKGIRELLAAIPAVLERAA